METPDQAKYPLAGKSSQHKMTLVDFGPDTLGERSPVIIAGINITENYDRTCSILRSVAGSGVKHVFFRKNADRFAPGNVIKKNVDYGQIIKRLKQQFGFYHICELFSPKDIHNLDLIADAWKLNNSSMANYQLLKELSSIQKPVILSKGILATVDEWLLAAEYLLNGNNTSVILGAGGIRSMDPLYTEMVDLNSVLKVKEISHLPVIADISANVSSEKWVSVLAKSQVIAGVDGIIIDVMQDAEESDGKPVLSVNAFSNLVIELKQMNEFK